MPTAPPSAYLRRAARMPVQVVPLATSRPILFQKFLLNATAGASGECSVVATYNRSGECVFARRLDAARILAAALAEAPTLRARRAAALQRRPLGARAARAGRARRRGVACRRTPRPALPDAARSVRAPAAPAPRLDAARERGQPAPRRRRRLAAALFLRAAGTPGRRHGELRYAGRRRRAARRFV